VEKPKNKNKSSEVFEKDNKHSPLSPVNEDLFNFLDALFTGEGEFPERIEVRTVKGRHKDQYGLQLKQFVYKQATVKPNREVLVNMTNDIVHR